MNLTNAHRARKITLQRLRREKSYKEQRQRENERKAKIAQAEQEQIKREAKQAAEREAALLEYQDEILAEEEHLADLKQKAQVRKYAIPVIRAIICSERDNIGLYQYQLKRQRKIDRISGTQYPVERRRIAEMIQSSKDEIFYWTSVLRKHAARPRKCSKPETLILNCWREDTACDEPIGTYVEILRTAKDELSSPTTNE